ncbi:dipeptide/oligopeptide/nickel ABC transporter permease/ATP-binding protein [Corynebacterium sp. H128]|uniref:dipeptide/oligopeptide/nickel ABC transporter permease/ATP-binding protein n=1 Tax=unclassified Corynebacterium TaxID=2624378 RepID=UPI0030ADB681
MFNFLKAHPAGVGVLLALISYALVVPALFDAGNPSFATSLQPPSVRHIFGTDHFGLDVFVRTAQSLRVSLAVGLISALGATFLGAVVGLLAASIGGWVDGVIMRINDAVNSLPQLVLSVVVVAVFKGSLTALILAIACTHWSSVARVVRSSVLAARTSDYVDAAYSAGAGTRWVTRKHLAPAALGQSAVAVIMLMPHAVWHESTLSFLGLGIPADGASLGTLLDLARADVIRGAWWTLLFPALALLATTLSAMSLTQRRKPAPLGVVTSEQAVADGGTGVQQLSINVGDTEILRSVSLELRPGAVHGLVGESGSGKSTLGKVLLGIAPTGATVSGAVLVGGEGLVIGSDDFAAVRGGVLGFVPQAAAQSFSPIRRVGAQVQEVIDSHGGSHTLDELFSLVSLPAEAALCFPHQLSGGMAQRVAIAAALAGDPQFLVADEPTSSLDPELTAALLQVLRRVADSGVGVLLISHDLEDLRETQVCDQISVMHRGTIVESGTEIFTQPQHEYTRALLAALPSGGLRHD